MIELERKGSRISVDPLWPLIKDHELGMEMRLCISKCCDGLSDFLI